jgi:hydroxymethylpyrimidine pyrophosphatase-like HAD family hydrolase
MNKNNTTTTTFRVPNDLHAIIISKKPNGISMSAHYDSVITEALNSHYKLLTKETFKSSQLSKLNFEKIKQATSTQIGSVLSLDTWCELKLLRYFVEGGNKLISMQSIIVALLKQYFNVKQQTTKKEENQMKKTSDEWKNRKYLSTTEVAKIVDRDPSTILKRIKANKLNATWQNSQWHITPADVQKTYGIA